MLVMVSLVAVAGVMVLWRPVGRQIALTVLIVWLLLVGLTWLLRSYRAPREYWQRLEGESWAEERLARLGGRRWFQKSLVAVLAIASLLLTVVWVHHAIGAPLGLTALVVWVFGFAVAMLAFGSRKFERLHNQVGLALVSGLVLAAAALMVNVAVEQALGNSARERREADTKLAINRRDQLIFRSENLSEFSLAGMSFATPIDREPFDFSYATMNGVHLENADLRRAVLRDTELAGAAICGADLGGADLSRANLSDAHLENAKLPGTRLMGAKLHRAYLGGADLSNADLSGADLTDLMPSGESGPAKGSGDSEAAAIGRTDPCATSEGRAGVVLAAAILTDARLVNADLSGADLTDAVLEGADLTGTNLQNAKVTARQLDGTRIMSGETICPDGTRATLSSLGKYNCRGNLGDQPDPPEPVEAVLAIESTAPRGTPVGRVGRAALGEERVQFELVSICPFPADDQEEGDAAADCLGSDEWPLTVGVYDGLLRVARSFSAGERLTVDVLVSPLGETANTDGDQPSCDSQEGMRGEACILEFDVAGVARNPVDTTLEFLVRADAGSGTRVGRIELEDAVLASGSDRFRIVETGDDQQEIVVDGVLEADTTYELVAQTGPEVESQQTLRMMVSVYPRNDPPELVVPVGPVEVSGRAQVGEVVGLVEATDSDEGDVLLFRIVSSERAPGRCDDDAVFGALDEQSWGFTIDPSTGELAVRLPLAQMAGCHRVGIEARDSAVDTGAGYQELLLEVAQVQRATGDQRLRKASW